jgi:Fe2+ transport system protein B
MQTGATMMMGFGCNAPDRRDARLIDSRANA